MKRTIAFSTMTALLLAFILFSCQKEQLNRTTSSKTPAPVTAEKTWYLYHATWQGWGRASKGCDGWGLCNYTDCWDCEVNAVRSGTVLANDETGEGHLYIELNPADQRESQAIQTHETFYVDEDIVNQNSILHAGAYAFNPEIGQHGGYMLDMTVTNFY